MGRMEGRPYSRSASRRIFLYKDWMVLEHQHLPTFDSGRCMSAPASGSRCRWQSISALLSVLLPICIVSKLGRLFRKRGKAVDSPKFQCRALATFKCKDQSRNGWQREPVRAWSAAGSLVLQEMQGRAHCRRSNRPAFPAIQLSPTEPFVRSSLRSSQSIYFNISYPAERYFSARCAALLRLHLCSSSLSSPPSIESQ